MARRALQRSTGAATAKYGPRLRRNLASGEVKQVIREATKQVWPNLNRAPFRLGSPSEFVRHWWNLGIEVRLAHLPGPRGLGLLGFYVNKIRGVCERPMICVNVAHHPALVGTALAHEMGHHLTARLFGSRSETAHPLLREDFEQHLECPKELVADVQVSLGIFPAEIARRLFDGDASPVGSGSPEQSLREPVSDPAFKKLVGYLASHYGFNLAANLPEQMKLHCFAALLHYTRLRRALLDEYDI